jgi:hypothetical protein
MDGGSGESGSNHAGTTSAVQRCVGFPIAFMVVRTN